MTEAPLGDSIASTSRTRVKTQGRRRPAGSSVRCEHEPIRRERSEVANRAMVIASTEPVARVASRQWDRVRTPPAEGRQVPGTPVTLAPRDGRRVRPASRRVPWRAGAGKLNGVDSNSEVRRGRAAQTRIRNGGPGAARFDLAPVGPCHKAPAAARIQPHRLISTIADRCAYPYASRSSASGRAPDPPTVIRSTGCHRFRRQSKPFIGRSHG
jgi:hypothetical protein